MSLSNDTGRPTTNHETNNNQHLYHYHKVSKVKKRKYYQIIDEADEKGDECKPTIKRKKSKYNCHSVMLSQNNVGEVSNRNKYVHGMPTLMSEDSCRRFEYHSLIDDENLQYEKSTTCTSYRTYQVFNDDSQKIRYRKDDDKENETKQQDIQHEHIGYDQNNQQSYSLFTTTPNTTHKSLNNIMNHSILLSCRDKELIQRAFILGVMKSQVHVRNNTCISTASNNDRMTNITKGFSTKSLQNYFSTIDADNNHIDYRHIGSCHNNLKENNNRGSKTRILSRCDHEEWCDWEAFKNTKKKNKNKLTLQWDFMKYDQNDVNNNSLCGVEDLYEINSITNDLYHNNLKEENVVDNVSEHDDDSRTEMNNSSPALGTY